jgi:hypothetical protein
MSKLRRRRGPDPRTTAMSGTRRIEAMDTLPTMAPVAEIHEGRHVCSGTLRRVWE